MIVVSLSSTYYSYELMFNLCSVTRFGKFCHFGMTLKNFGHFERVHLVFGKKFKLLLYYMLLGKFSVPLMAKNWTNNLSIWSHWICSRNRIQHLGRFEDFLARSHEDLCVCVWARVMIVDKIALGRPLNVHLCINSKIKIILLSSEIFLLVSVDRDRI